MPYPNPIGYYAQTPTLDAMQERYDAAFDRMSKRDKSAMLMALAESLHMVSDNSTAEALDVILENWSYVPDDLALLGYLADLDTELTEPLAIEIIRALAEQMSASLLNQVRGAYR